MAAVVFWRVWKKGDDETGYGSIEDPVSSLRLTAAKFADDVRDMLNPEEVVIEQPSITVEFDYPLREPHRAEIHAKNGHSFTRVEVAEAIARHYQEIYAEEARTTTVWDTMATNGTYGIWGHNLGDLDMGCVHQREDGVWNLDIDS